LILTLPFSSACCERAFSVMNEIKNKKRNRLGEILRGLMVIATCSDNEFYELDMRGMSTHVAGSVWKNKKSSRWASDDYMRSIA